MIDFKGLGFNNICPVCGKRIEMIDIHINAFDGVQNIKGRCFSCDSCFEVSEINDPDLDIKTKWNRIMKEGK